VPPELNFYAVDEKELEKERLAKKEIKASEAHFRTGAPTDKDNVAVQIQRWVDYAYPTGPKNPVPVGDWLVAERVLAHRGEYLRRKLLTEVPIWYVAKDNFVIAPNPKNKNDKRCDLDFGNPEGPPAEAVLVDFNGGRVVYEKAPEKVAEDKKPTGAKVIDTAPVEMLVLMPDGRLLLRDSVADAADNERTARRETWDKRIKEIKKGGDKGPPRPGEGLFDNSRPGGGKGGGGDSRGS